jgi:hypothetical protein
MESELAKLIKTYPDNDAHNQEIDGHIIDVFREEAQAYWNSFVAVNKAQRLRDQGGKNVVSSSSNLKGMNCGEKYEFLKKEGIMR